MAEVLGIGGFFFKAYNVDELRLWYQRVLGFEITGWGGAVFGPLPRGKTAWMPFAADTTHFEPSQRDCMINLVVDDLDGMLARLAAENVPVLHQQEMAGMGRFASILDPAGLKIELWEPA